MLPMLRVGCGVLIAATYLSFASVAHAQTSAGADLRVGWPLTIDHFDPALTDSAMAASLSGHVFETLLKATPEGEIAPQLAIKWKASEDGKYWDLTLRQGITFTDGEKFSAAAVKANFDRLVDKSLTVPQRANVAMIANVEVLDEYTVRLHTLRPDSGLPYQLVKANTGIVSPATIKKYYKGFGNELGAGTGPMRIKSSSLPDKIVLVPNENYWGPHTSLKSLEITSIADNAARSNALLSGEIDVDVYPTSQDIKRFARDPSFKVVSVPSMRAILWHLPFDKPEFSDLRVRQAINHAVDKKTIVDKIYNGAAFPMDSAIGPGTSGYSSQPIFDYDLKRTENLMAQAGWKKNATGKYLNASGKLFPTLEVKASRDRYPSDMQLAEAVTGYLTQAGFDVHLELMEYATFFEQMTKSHGGSGWTIQMSWGSSMDGNNFLCDKYIKGRPYNYGNYVDEHLEALCNKVAQTFDQKERTALLTEGTKFTYENAPMIDLITFSYQAVMRSKINGALIHPGENHSFAYATVK